MRDSKTQLHTKRYIFGSLGMSSIFRIRKVTAFFLAYLGEHNKTKHVIVCRMVSLPFKPDGEWRAMVRFLRSSVSGVESRPLASKWLEPDAEPQSIFASVNSIHLVSSCTTVVIACG